MPFRFFGPLGIVNSVQLRSRVRKCQRTKIRFGLQWSTYALNHYYVAFSALLRFARLFRQLLLAFNSERSVYGRSGGARLTAADGQAVGAGRNQDQAIVGDMTQVAGLQ